MVFPTHTDPDTPLSSIEPDYFEGTCLLTPRGKMQVINLRVNRLETITCTLSQAMAGQLGLKDEMIGYKNDSYVSVTLSLVLADGFWCAGM